MVVEGKVIRWYRLNLYDTKVLRCNQCGKCIGEIDYDSNVVFSICGVCSRLIHETSKNNMYIKNELGTNKKLKTNAFEEKVTLMV